ncbi:subtilisin-like protein [Lactarius akahatsu]|uniref:tripeptidyl-peptidase II n=1 Tax=Lactarius akahatsu TaxID=416441 RepID=A0AAD4Q9N6_9AGAM|nr:subtilisin-like protein [Lactarius akahatsu]
MRYHWLYALSFLTATPLADFATPLAPWRDMQVKHTWNAVPANWETLGCPPAGTTIDLYIALNSRHDDALIDALYEVSDPKHPRYGAHLSKEQVAELVRPHPDTLELANQMLGASYQLYRHATVNDTIIRTVSYALPDVLHAHIQAVAPTTYFASARTLRQAPRRRPVEAATALAEAETASSKPVTVLSSRAGRVTPSQLRWMYKTFAYVPVATDRNTLGVFGFQKQYPSENDLTTFMSNFATMCSPPLVNGGEYDPNTPGIGANIDVQQASAMAYPTPIIFYSVGGTGEISDSGEPMPGDVYLESLDYLLQKTDIPQTISISYGSHEWHVPPEYARALCILFAQLGTRGVTVLYSTGDNGVGKECEDESGNVRFVIEFPASCPYLTAVGGTTEYDPEVAAPLSGGGFSDHFPRPVYQDVAVSAFLSRQGTHPEGRGIPDIAAQALRFPLVVGNAHFLVDGTSCSAPTVAGIISLLNDYLITNGRSPLGFLNIRLYDDGFAGLNDITSGSNPGCGTDGFSAVPGWDPVTGVGTPDFEKLQNIFMIL